MNKTYVIDTCSLLNLVRYYKPFDEKFVLSELFQKYFKDKTFVMLKSVLDECCRIRKGEIIEGLPFLKEKIHIKKDLIVVTPKMHNKIDNNWVEKSRKKILVDEKGDFSLTMYNKLKKAFTDEGTRL